MERKVRIWHFSGDLDEYVYLEAFRQIERELDNKLEKEVEERKREISSLIDRAEKAEKMNERLLAIIEKIGDKPEGKPTPS